MLATDGYEGTSESEPKLPNGDIDPEDVEFDPGDLDDDSGDWPDDDDDEGGPTTHRQEAAQWGDKRDLVDVEMAPLVTEIWRADLETYSSCQDVGESLADLGLRLPYMAAYVETRREQASIDLAPPDAQRFLDIIAGAGPAGSVYDRMTRWTADGAWRYGLVMLDLPEDDGTYSFRILAIQVGFPRGDIPAVTRCFRRHNARVERAGKAAIARARKADAETADAAVRR